MAISLAESPATCVSVSLLESGKQVRQSGYVGMYLGKGELLASVCVCVCVCVRARVHAHAPMRKTHRENVDMIRVEPGHPVFTSW